MSQPTAGIRLPKKEAELFRTLVSCYEGKQYNKGVKIADTILKKFPNNGETQAMKGIIVNSLGRKEEAYELVKAGVRNDVRSHICWHVYGLLYRSDGNYKEAIKCYLNALRIDPSNQNILRDLSWLQVQMRDLFGFAKTRKIVLDSKPQLRASWTTFAVANYLLKDYDLASTIVSKWFEIAKQNEDPFEDSELLLFQSLCLEQQGRYADAITHLQNHKKAIIDKNSWDLKHAQMLTMYGYFDEATACWEALLTAQPENYKCHRGAQIAWLRLSILTLGPLFKLKRLDLPCSATELTTDQKELLLDRYEKFPFFKKSRACQKIKLFLLQGSKAFPGALEEFVLRSLEDGLPSLHHDVCALVQTNRDGHLVAVTDPSEFANHPVAKACLEFLDRANAQFKSPQAELWALYLKAHLLECSGNIEGALTAIEQAVNHTPTAVDMHAKKARILKKAGQLLNAAICMDECRALDLQDRYLNNKATKYFLRANHPAQALATISLFVKHDAGDVSKQLDDLQCSWYQAELGECYSRLRQWGPALKQFYAIRKHFDVQYDDLFDFHGYCIRKSTLRAYMDVLTTQDGSRGHPNFQRAFRGAVSILLHLLDAPEDIDGLGHLPPDERKKQRTKLKKKKAKELLEREKAKANANGEGEDTKKVDEDPNGEQLLTRDFNSEVAAWCSLLAPHLEHCSEETLALFADACVKRAKFLPAARAIMVDKGKKVKHPALHLSLVRLLHRAKGNKKANAMSLTAAREVLQPLVGEGLQNYALAYLEESVRSSDFTRILSALKALVLLDKSHVAKFGDALNSEDVWRSPQTTARAVASAVEYLRSMFETEPFTAAFVDRAKAKFGDCILDTLSEEKPEAQDGDDAADAAVGKDA